MIHEKIFQLKSGREVKVVVKSYFLHDNPQRDMECEILIREPKEKYFRTPIGVNHPQYWKMKRSSAQQAKVLLMEYSGITQRQINQAMEASAKSLKELARTAAQGAFVGQAASSSAMRLDDGQPIPAKSRSWLRWSVSTVQANARR